LYKQLQKWKANIKLDIERKKSEKNQANIRKLMKTNNLDIKEIDPNIFKKRVREKRKIEKKKRKRCL